MEDEGAHAQRDGIARVGRVEGGLEARVSRPAHTRDARVEPRIVALARAHARPFALELDLDLAEAAVALRVRGLVAEQVVGLRLGRDAADAAAEVVGVLDREAAALGGERLRALRGQLAREHGAAEVLAPEAADPQVAHLGRHPELRRHLDRHALEPARVEEVEGDVGAPGGFRDALELVEGRVVDEAVRDEHHRLAAAAAGQGDQEPPEQLERGTVAVDAVQVHLGGALRDEGVVQDGLALRAAREAGGNRVVRLQAPQDAPRDLRVAVDVDPHRLVGRHPLGRHVGDEAAVEPLEQRHELVAAGLHAGAPPGAAAGRHQDHAVALARALFEELRHRALRAVGVRQRQVAVVEDDHERAPGGSGRVPGVRRDARPLPWLVARPARRIRELNRLEAADRLRAAVLQHGEIGGGQPPDRPTAAIDDRGVHGDELDLGRKGRLLLRRGGRLRASRARPSHHDEGGGQGEARPRAMTGHGSILSLRFPSRTKYGAGRLESLPAPGRKTVLAPSGRQNGNLAPNCRLRASQLGATPVMKPAFGLSFPGTPMPCRGCRGSRG